MPQKPRRRKKSGLKSIYIIAVVAVVILAAVGLYWYIYLRAPSPIYAIINTTKGSFEIELFPSSAPKTVANFVSLAKSGFYDNLVWHRIEPNFVIQTGDPSTRNGGGNRSLWGTQGSNTTVPLEIDPSLHNDVGYLGMARGNDPNSGTSQFYINLTNNTSLDGRYTVFGKVISGMSAVQAIGSVPVEPVGSQHEPVTPIYVISITILSKGP